MTASHRSSVTSLVACMLVLLARPLNAGAVHELHNTDSSRDGECKSRSCPVGHTKVWLESTSAVTVFNMRGCACLCVRDAD